MAQSPSDDRWFTDHPASTRWPHYTRANAGEVLPTPASPLGQTFGFDIGILQGFQRASERTGFYELSEYRDGAPEMCGFFGGYFYLNLSNIRMQAVRNPAVTIDQLDMAFFGAHPDVPTYRPHPDDHKPHLQPTADAHMNFVLTSSEWPELDDDRTTTVAMRAARPDLSALDDHEIVERALAMTPTIVHLASQHFLASSSSGIAPGMLAAVAEAIDDSTIPMRLLASLGDVDSAEPSYAIWDMSRLIRGSTELTCEFDAGISGVVGRLSASASADAIQFLQVFTTFLRDFGSRGPNEWELSAETWETDPTIALAAIDRVRFQADDQSPTARSATMADGRKALVDEVRAKVAELGDETLIGVFEGALVGGNMMIFRERAKTNIIRCLHEARMMFRELGERHAIAGTLSEASHIFMLTNDDLSAFASEPSAWTDVLTERAQGWDKLWQLEPPFFIRDSEVPPLRQWDAKGAATTTIAEVDETLTGVAGSPGVIEGRARVVLDAADPPDLMPGDIMVAPITDPAWTPLFMAVDGVVVNVGGQISHAIIVSRELGLPCVVSVTDATTRIPDGAKIRVNGTTGEVTIVALP